MTSMREVRYVVVQTFVTSTNTDGPLQICRETARILDTPRLGKQRIECQQIFTALDTGKGWIHHPATKMWAGSLGALCSYGYWMCEEWRDRGYEDTMLPWFYDRLPDGGVYYEDWPWWFGHPEMVRTHRSKLIHKLPTKYRPVWGHSCVDRTLTIPSRYRLPYIWPGPVQREGFKLSAAEQKRADFTIPHHWTIDVKTRQVLFS